MKKGCFNAIKCVYLLNILATTMIALDPTDLGNPSIEHPPTLALELEVVVTIPLMTRINFVLLANFTTMILYKPFDDVFLLLKIKFGHNSFVGL